VKHKRSKSSSGTKAVTEAGSKLREIREGRGLTMRDVHGESRSIAQKHGRRGFEMVPSRLHMLERGMHVPNVFRLYSLSTIYGISVKELFGLYGLKLSGTLHAGKK
jgi:transcriptional regulator with XRE-family HTH domain